MRKHVIQSRLQIAVDLALDTLDHNFEILFSMGMADAAKRSDNGVLDALNLIEVVHVKIGVMRGNHYAEYDDCVADFAHIGSLIRAIALSIGQRDDALGTAAQRSTYYVDVLLHQIEVA